MENTFDKYFSIRRVWKFNITVEFCFFINPWQDNRFRKNSRMPILSNILKLVSSIVVLHEMALKVLDLHDR